MFLLHRSLQLPQMPPLRSITPSRRAPHLQFQQVPPSRINHPFCMPYQRESGYSQNQTYPYKKCRSRYAHCRLALCPHGGLLLTSSSSGRCTLSHLSPHLHGITMRTRTTSKNFRCPEHGPSSLFAGVRRLVLDSKRS